MDLNGSSRALRNHQLTVRMESTRADVQMETLCQKINLKRSVIFDPRLMFTDRGTVDYYACLQVLDMLSDGEVPIYVRDVTFVVAFEFLSFHQPLSAALKGATHITNGRSNGI